ncbi:MAG: RNase H family protein, partial [bacterium]
MPSEYADLLIKRAQEFAAQLQSAGVPATVQKTTLREYSIKLDLTQGRAVLYYKPKKAQFQCQSENVPDEALWSQVLACWEDRRTTSAASVPTSALQPDTVVEVYVDGSWVAGTTSYGVVVVQGDAAIWEDSGVLSADESGDSRQVAGELQAVRVAMLWCREHGIKQATVHYDYAGIEHWATGKWKAKQPLTQRYRSDIENLGIEITWNKVEAHTGVKWNEMADTLANSAASNASGRNAISEVTSLADVESYVMAFSAFLRPRGVVLEIRRKEAVPTPHVQASVASGSESWGHLNVYGSAGKAPYPKFHEVHPEVKQGVLEQFWRQFKAPLVNELDEVNYYLGVFEPYEGLQLDFKLLADAVARVWAIRMSQPFDRARVRYNLATLKECVALLRQPTN